jgi:hypothetical protein
VEREKRRRVPGADRRRLRRTAALIAASCVVPAILDGWQSYMQWRLGGGDGSPWAGVAFQAGEWIILGSLTPIVYLLAMRFPPRPPRLARHLLVHLGGALVLCVGWASAGIGLRAMLGILPERMRLVDHAASWMLTSLPWSVFMYFAILGSVLAFAYFFESREREATAARLEAQVAASRLGALRMQLRPHFLFNSLNAVAVLVRDRRTEEAARVVEQLSDILRQLLAGENEQEVPLSREVALLRKFLAIEEVRFSDRLNVVWRIDPSTEEALVPSFALQPLVENALRHGVAAMSEPGTVAIDTRVEGDDLVVRVSNDVPDAGSRAERQGSGVGIRNTRERLATMYGERAGLSLDEEPGRVTAIMRLPFRTSTSPSSGVP